MKRNINRDRTHKSHRHGRTERPPFSHVVSVGSDGFKIGQPQDADIPHVELPADRPPIEDIIAAHRSGCMPAILRFFMRRKYGTDFTESKYVPPERCTHGVLLAAPCEKCREENPEFLS